MSYNIWISQLDANKKDVLQFLGEYASKNKGLLQACESEESAGSEAELDTMVMSIKEHDGKTLIGGARHLCPEMLTFLSGELKGQVESVDWNDQDNLMHYSRIVNGETMSYFTHLDDQFIESYQVDCEGIVQSGITSGDIEATGLTDAESNQYIFDTLTLNFDTMNLFWEGVEDEPDWYMLCFKGLGAKRLVAQDSSADECSYLFWSQLVPN